VPPARIATLEQLANELWAEADVHHHDMRTTRDTLSLFIAASGWEAIPPHAFARLVDCSTLVDNIIGGNR
jgi:hypothetical protein